MRTMSKAFPYYTVSEVVRKLSEARGKPYTTRAIQKMIERGKFKNARKTNPDYPNSDWLIPIEDYAVVEKQIKKRGQAAKAT